MKIILLDKIQRLGEIGDIVEVNSGYARNFLIPKKLKYLYLLVVSNDFLALYLILANLINSVKTGLLDILQIWGYLFLNSNVAKGKL